MNKKKEIEELKATLNKIGENFLRFTQWWDGETAYAPKPQKVNTEKATDVTLEELAKYVLDGTPIVRNVKTSVYEPEKPSTDGKAGNE